MTCNVCPAEVTHKVTGSIDDKDGSYCADHAPQHFQRKGENWYEICLKNPDGYKSIKAI